MTGGVDEVQDVGLAIVCLVFDADRVGLDRDAALFLDIHGIQKLCFHIAISDCSSGLDQAISKRGFTVVDVGHDGKIADFGYVCHEWGYDTDLGFGQGIWGFVITFPPKCA